MEHYAQTDRLLLRRFTAADAGLLIELDGDPEVMRHLTGGAATPAELVRDRDLPDILAGYDRWDGRFGLFAAHERDGDAFVGWFCLRPEPDGPQDEAELAYRLRRQAWGRGYATEGARALLGKAFDELGARLVWGATMVVNVPSQRVMDKVGMTVAEAIPTPDYMQAVEGAEQGGLLYEISREQWASARDGRHG